MKGIFILNFMEYWLIFEEIVVGLWLNKIVFFNIVKLGLVGVIIFLFGNNFFIVFRIIGDFENLFIRRIFDKEFFENDFMIFVMCWIIFCNVLLKKFLKICGWIFNLFVMYLIVFVYFVFGNVFFIVLFILFL